MNEHFRSSSFFSPSLPSFFSHFWIHSVCELYSSIMNVCTRSHIEPSEVCSCINLVRREREEEEEREKEEREKRGDLSLVGLLKNNPDPVTFHQCERTSSFLHQLLTQISLSLILSLFSLFLSVSLSLSLTL